MSAKPKLIALNIALAAGVLLVAWQGRLKWQEALAQRRAGLNPPVRRPPMPPLVSTQKPDAVQAAKYADVAEKDPFSKDRNPSIVIEPPKVEAPKPMPPLPIAYGAMGLPSGISAIMAEHAGGTPKSVRVGDVIGDFKVVALDLNKVTFEWDGKQVERNLDDLIDRTGGATAPTASAGPAAPPPAPAAPTSASVGADIGTPDAPSRACTPGDNSPIGTVVDGYKKAGTDSPFGIMGCHWVKN